MTTIEVMFPRALIDRYDRDGFLRVLSDFPDQVENALKIETTIERIPNCVVIAGMGGSALGGQLLSDLVREELDVPLIVHRDYSVPQFVDHTSLVFAVSYSGNTEETVSAFESAIERGAEVVALSAGGRLRDLAERHDAIHLPLPPGLPPRMAWAYLCLPVLNILARAALVEIPTEGLERFMRELSHRFHPDRGSEAVEIAQALRGVIPVYCSSASTSILAYKWKVNTNENAKQQGFASVLPEANHNEMVAWHYPEDCLKKLALVFLRTDYESSVLSKRIEITKELVGDGPEKTLEFAAPGRTKIEQLFGSIYAGDWMSYYLALLNHENPTPVSAIELLKTRLAG